MVFNELKQHGTSDFPFQLYHIDSSCHNYEMVFHWHTPLEIIRIISGTLKVTIDNSTYILDSSSIVIVNSESVHSGIPSDCVYECIVFDVNALRTINSSNNGIIDKILNRSLKIQNPIDDQDIISTFDELSKVLHNMDQGYRFKTFGLFQYLIGLLQDKYLVPDFDAATESPDIKLARFKKALKFITDHFDEDLSLEDISKEVNLSPKYFNMVFKNLTGKTPFEFLISYRIEQAERFLINTDKSITQIAYDCGFNDTSYFIRTFKKLKNQSPLQFRYNYK